MFFHYLFCILTKYCLEQEGFWYHHAEPTYIMLVYWIPISENTIPANATHRVRIGAFVMNDKREVFFFFFLTV